MDICSTIQTLLTASESEVATHFNISTAALRQFRAEHMQAEGDHSSALGNTTGTNTSSGDWYRGKYNKLYFTAAGLSKIMEWLGLKTHVSAEISTEVTVMGFPPNPHMLKCILQDGTVVNVKVRSQVGFLKGMKLSVRSDPGSPLLIYKGPNPCNPKMERHFYKS